MPKSRTEAQETDKLGEVEETRVDDTHDTHDTRALDDGNVMVRIGDVNHVEEYPEA